MHAIIAHSIPRYSGNNEDALEVRSHQTQEGWTCAVLADGQGGRPGGARAAQTAITSASGRIECATERDIKKPAFWTETVAVSDSAVAKDPDAGFTTLVALAITGNSVIGASNGDCTAILLGRDAPPLILTSGQPKNPPVGSGGAASQAFTARLPAQWKVVLMSDGVSKYVDQGTLLSLIDSQTGEALLEAVKSAAKARGGGVLRDDLSFALIADS